MGPLATYLRVHTSTAAGHQPHNRHNGELTTARFKATHATKEHHKLLTAPYMPDSAAAAAAAAQSPKINPSPEAHFLLAKAPPVLKGLWCDHLHHRQVLGRGLQVLAQREDVDTAVLQVKHGVDDLVIC